MGLCRSQSAHRITLEMTDTSVDQRPTSLATCDVALSRHGVDRGLWIAPQGEACDHCVRRNTMLDREGRSLRPTANWQVWTMVFVVLVLIMIVWLVLR